MTDYKKEALDAISAAEIGGYDEVDTHLVLAQVHATLYLAEQQRIANIIAYAGSQRPDITTGISIDDAEVLHLLDEAYTALGSTKGDDE